MVRTFFISLHVSNSADAASEDGRVEIRKKDGIRSLLELCVDPDSDVQRSAVKAIVKLAQRGAHLI